MASRHPSCCVLLYHVFLLPCVAQRLAASRCMSPCHADSLGLLPHHVACGLFAFFITWRLEALFFISLRRVASRLVASTRVAFCHTAWNVLAYLASKRTFRFVSCPYMSRGISFYRVAPCWVLLRRIKRRREYTYPSMTLLKFTEVFHVISRTISSLTYHFHSFVLLLINYS